MFDEVKSFDSDEFLFKPNTNIAIIIIKIVSIPFIPFYSEYYAAPFSSSQNERKKEKIQFQKIAFNGSMSVENDLVIYK